MSPDNKELGGHIVEITAKRQNHILLVKKKLREQKKLVYFR